MVGILLEAMWPKRQLAGLHSFRVVVPSLLDRPCRLCRQENVASALSGETPSASRASATRPRGRLLPSLYIMSCAFAVALSPRRPLIAARNLHRARLGKTGSSGLGRVWRHSSRAASSRRHSSSLHPVSASAVS